MTIGEGASGQWPVCSSAFTRFGWGRPSRPPKGGTTNGGNVPRSERVVAGFLGADADGVFGGVDEHLAVADLAGLGGLDDDVNGRADQVVRDDHFDFDLGQKINGVFAAAVNLRVPLLAAEALDLGDGHALKADVIQGVFDLGEFVRFDDCFDFFHKLGRSG